MSIKFKDTDIDNLTVDKVYYKDEQIYPVEVKTWESGIQNFDDTALYTQDKPFEMEFTDLPNSIKPTSTMTFTINAPNRHYGVYGDFDIWIKFYNNDTGATNISEIGTINKSQTAASHTFTKVINTFTYFNANHIGSDTRKFTVSLQVLRAGTLSNSLYWGAGTFSVKINF